VSEITILQVAEARGAQRDDRGGINGAEFERVGLPIIGGCGHCGATVAAYNACPSKTGYLLCASGCIEGDGFETVEEFEAWLKEDDDE
jgi:hypothetical protein